ncbi:SNF2 family helicase/ATPase [Penicillium hispanicum]|uniref:SNF2 family helicase/ATPase n=1 Tax=Penicillium hispanicum TaxID=1080232 RepID=UPI00253F6FE7|nr:SNF2 family helicase/ATPase [Penicillium hispanicum]KAJ5584408.1 SNF2 family helicase/ATPase [Penicillium hispanicum]
MASNAAMLLDPKGYRKQVQAKGTDTTSLSPTPGNTTDPPDPVAHEPLGEMTQDSNSPSVSPSADPMDLDSTITSELSGSLPTGSDQQTASSSPRGSTPSIAPPGTVPALRSFTTSIHQSPTSASPISPGPGQKNVTKPDPGLTVLFTSAHDEGNESDAKRGYHDLSDGDGGTLPRNLIEDVYGVEQRTHQPVKKMRLDDSTTKSVTARRPITISGDSGLGNYMKEGETQPITGPSSLSAIVDLTAEAAGTPRNDEDDELQVTGSNDLSTQRVCYGKIENAMINASLVPKPKAPSIWENQWPSMGIELHREPRKGDFRINVSDPHGKVFGAIDAKTAHALCQLLDSPVIPLDIVARLEIRNVIPGEVPWEPTSGIYRVSLTLYGERQRAEIIGKHLSQYNVWLGIAASVEAGVPVFNPHAEKRRAIAAMASTSTTTRDRKNAIKYEARTTEEVTDSVTRMLNQLVSASFPTMDPPAQVKTPLLEHQKQALWFMTQKEKPRTFGPEEKDNSSLWRIEYQANGRKQYKEILSGVVLIEEPPQVLGGLLADMMGLGKTLSILSLALSSLPEADEWENMPPSSDLIKSVPGIRNTRTTLLVVPLSAVNNWVVQIKEHLEPESVKYYVFHGSSRTTDLDELSSYDLVITTYSTILSEVSGRNSKRGKSPLARMNMFRIVLDEAHTIREQNAQQTKAILSLYSQRRWSVTGTPVQNRLEDLMSVTKFLGLFPYDDRSRFSQHILSPFKTGDPNVLASLRVLVDSFTLRRVKDRIDLPPREDKIILLDFSEKERQLHEFFRKESNVMMRVIAGESRAKMGGRMYHHVLKAMMILRQVSAHGKELLDLEDRERIKGQSMHDAIDLEENVSDDTSAATDKKAFGMFSLMKASSGDQCALCTKALDEPLTNTGEVDGNAAMAIFLPCFDVLCPDCFSGWKSAFDSQSKTDLKCQVCDGWIPMTYSTITSAGLKAFENEQSQQKNRKSTKMFGEYEGPHTKTIALLEHLQESAAESAKLIGEPPIKTVIFSAWTSHLDLIEIALKNNGFDSFTRLDGTMSLAARGKALHTFANDDSITILLATIGAGGVGLNLTSASQVFIMEPQYNPAAVAQAVDRVHRLGQKRAVRTIQFIMKGSIEEKILELAKKKQQLADMSMNRAKLDKREVQEQRMREYRALFR